MSDETKVTISGVGFGDGADFDRLYGFFASGDGQLLKVLKTAFGGK